MNPLVDRLGTQRWYNESGQLHRVGGPAIIRWDNVRMWYVNGKLHRLDGPAVEWANGERKWWLNDEPFERKEFDKHPLVVFVRLCKKKVM